MKMKYEYKVILGIIWGLGISCIFGYACNSRKCIICKSSKPINIENNIYNYNEKCYTYSTVDTQCENS
jgi:hypothetical protein